MTSTPPVTTEQVPISDIRIVPAWRRPVRAGHVAALRAHINDLPPILVSADLRLVDGEHRLQAHTAAGLTKISVRRLPADLSDVDLLAAAVEANTRHGLPLTSQQRTEAAKDLLRAGWHGSDRSLASLCGISKNRVNPIRRQVAAEGPPRVPQGHLEGISDRREGRDGKRYPTDPEALRRAILREHRLDPHATNGHIARRTGASPTTVARTRRGLPRRPRTAGPFTHFRRFRRLASRLASTARRWVARRLHNRDTASDGPHPTPSAERLRGQSDHSPR